VVKSVKEWQLKQDAKKNTNRYEKCYVSATITTFSLPKEPKEKNRPFVMTVWGVSRLQDLLGTWICCLANLKKSTLDSYFIQLGMNTKMSKVII